MNKVDLSKMCEKCCYLIDAFSYSDTSNSILYFNTWFQFCTTYLFWWDKTNGRNNKSIKHYINTIKKYWMSSASCTIWINIDLQSVWLHAKVKNTDIFFEEKCLFQSKKMWGDLAPLVKGSLRAAKLYTL